MSAEHHTPEYLHKLESSAPIQYIRIIVEQTENKILETITNPSQAVRRAIKLGIYNIIANIRKRPFANFEHHRSEINQISKEAKQQIDSVIVLSELEDLHRKIAHAIQNILYLGKSTLINEFEEFFASLMN